jgi:Deoxyxylulose-5-phosphate synthase
VSIYSTFLQRAYDQLIHDICLNELPVIFAVDRSGIVGRDGDTHQGIFDISYLTSIPNMTVLSPMSGRELEQCLDFAYDHNGPVAVRYPRGDIYEEGREEIICEKHWELGRARILMVRGRLLEEKEEADPGQIKGDAVLFAVGNMTKTALDVGRLLQEKNIYCTVINMRFVKPFDKELLLDLVRSHQMVATLEDNVKNGGFGQQAEALFVDEGCVPEIFLNCSIDDCFVEHGAPEELYERLEMDARSVAEKIERMLREHV